MVGQLSHISFLLPSVEEGAKIFAAQGFYINPLETFEKEGTKEIYVGDFDQHTALPLLTEPLQNGPYRKAFNARGSGLHHIAIDVMHLEDFLDYISGSGWLLHPTSLRSARELKTIYLARPGLPTLIEVQQRDAFSKKEPLVTKLEIPLDEKQLRMMQALGLEQVVPGKEISLHFNNKKINLKDLIKSSI